MNLSEYFLISAFFSTAFCYSSLFFTAFEDVAEHMAATNYDIVVTNCDHNDELFKSVVMDTLMMLQFPVKVKNCSSEKNVDDDKRDPSNAEILRLIYETEVEITLDYLQMPVVPINKSGDAMVFKLQKSTVIAANDEGWLREIIENLQLQNMYPTHIQIVVACPDVTFEEIQTVPDSNILHKVYFLIEDESSVKLLTFDWFTREHCEDKQLVVVNEYQKSTGWKNGDFEIKKFFDFHGCHIGIGVTQDYPASGITRLIDSEGNEVQGNYEYHGYYVTMIKDVSKNLNFEFTFNPSLSNYFRDDGLYFYTNISVEFRTLSCGTERYLDFPFMFYMTNAHAFAENYLLVPPGELYTDLEKFLLPFDMETWICIIVVFVVAVVVIFIVGYLSDSVKNEVYGIGVHFPILNFFAHFFGVGQNVLPTRDFARITLMTYILFSLIIRTAYQSKMFEFLQKEMRKPEIKSIKEVIEKNLTIHVDHDQFFLIEKLDIFQRAHYINDTWEQYVQIAHVGIYDSNFKGAIQISSKVWQGMVEDSEGKIASRLLKIFRFNVEAIGMCLPANHKFFDVMSEITDRLMAAGIMQEWVKVEYDSADKKYAHLYYEEPQKLSLDDLEVGFLLCLICLGFSFLVFCFEDQKPRQCFLSENLAQPVRHGV